LNLYGLLNSVLFGPFIRRRVRVTVIGRENLPKTGAFILAMGSHTTEVESVIVAAWLRERQLHFYAKSDYWNRPGLKGHAQGWYMSAVGHIPVERGGSRAVLDAINAGVDVLRRGEVLAVYPEGTRVSDGKVHGAHPGTVDTLLKATLAEYQATGVMPRIPIIPVGLIHMGSVSSPKGGFVPWRGEAMIRIGRPMYPSSMELKGLKNGGRPAQRLLREEISRRMMKRIAHLCEKEYDSHKLPLPTDGN